MYGRAGEFSLLVSGAVGESGWEVVILSRYPATVVSGRDAELASEKRWIGALLVSARWLRNKRYEDYELAVIEVMFMELALRRVKAETSGAPYAREWAMLLPALRR